MAFVSVPLMDFIPYGIPSGTNQQAKNNLRIGIHSILRPAWNADVVLAGHPNLILYQPLTQL